MLLDIPGLSLSLPLDVLVGHCVQEAGHHQTYPRLPHHLPQGSPSHTQQTVEVVLDPCVGLHHGLHLLISMHTYTYT